MECWVDGGSQIRTLTIQSSVKTIIPTASEATDEIYLNREILYVT